MNTKVAVVTGGASGIGYALAQRFLADGMSVVIGDVEQGALEAAVTRLGAAAHGMTVDVADRSSVDALRDYACALFGRVDVVCNNAGIGGGDSRAWEMPSSAWDRVMAVNFGGVLNGVRSFLPLLLEQRGGHVVNTASMAGLIAGPQMAAYNVSKSAVVALSETLFHDLRELDVGVGVSVLCPGFVATNIIDSHRNWPAEAGPPPDDVSAHDPARRAELRALLAGGMQPAEVATHVIDAISQNRLWVLPSPQMRPLVTERADQIVTARNPDTSPYL